jgi:hypothetical protein
MERLAGEEIMRENGAIGALTGLTVLVAVNIAAVVSSIGTARAFDDAQYPDFSGEWLGVRPPIGGQPGFDPYKLWGLGQQAPLTPEYQKVLEASVADQAAGGQGNWRTGADCLPPGMPGMMTAFQAMEVIVLPETTYVRIDHAHDSHRRIYTDGRDWPKDGEVARSFMGYSIGRWIDEKGDGHYTTLLAETRFLRGPRSLDPAGLPVHADNLSIIKERIFLDDDKLLHDEITLIDHAYTRPWTVFKTYKRDPAPYPVWLEYPCSGDQELIKIGKETYFRGGDDNLMPTGKDQPPPDLRYFKTGEFKPMR